ncbi:hypothetical protein GGD38_000484 [Chitinophagaceae bacterium OAS944]|nr:hypothetical protein [Chitinophagaceae bacterium OAS944]
MISVNFAVPEEENGNKYNAKRKASIEYFGK